MPADCDTPHRYKSYSVVRPIRRIDFVSKKPDQAPRHMKTDADILAGLNQKLNDGIAARNGRTPWQCPGCELLDDVKILESENTRTVRYIWTERYELRDADGNIIRGTASYMASGDARVKTTVYERHCDEVFGDDADAFYASEKSLGKFNLKLVPEYDLEKFWDMIPKELKEDMEFIKKKGKK